MDEALQVGNVATLHSEFTNQAGQRADPVTIDLTVVKPDGTTAVHQIGALIHVGTGLYDYDQALDQRGVWTYTYEGHGNGVDAGPLMKFLVVGLRLSPGPCDDWITDEDVFACGPCAEILESDRNYALAQTLAHAASEFYWTHSGRQFSGLCEETLRPCCRPTCTTAMCGCPDPIMISLPRPLRGVLEVLQDGQVVPPTSYRIDQSRWLVRTDNLPWPSCQNLRAAPTEVNTFQVRILRGTLPPTMGVLAAREFACELYQGCTGGDCTLPTRVTNVARQGVTMQFIRPEEVGLDGTGKIRTGLRVGQLFLATYPGNKGRARPTIASPDSVSSVWRVS